MASLLAGPPAPPSLWRFVATPSWVAASAAALTELVPATTGILLGALARTRGDLAAVPLAVWIAIAAALVVTPVAGYFAATRLRLVVSSTGIAYDSLSLGLVFPWSAAVTIERTGTREDAIALRFDRPGVMKARGVFMGIARRPIAWDRTVPLEPFLRGDPDRAALGAIIANIPWILEVAPRRSIRLMERAWLRMPVMLILMIAPGYLLTSRALGLG